MERKRERERDGGDQDRTMEERLTKAAIEGDVHELGKILREDKLILDKIMAGCFKTNPLHVAISRNQAGFVKELLRLNKDLAEVMDSGRSALHLAAAKGNIEIVKALIEASRDMCLARDPEGMNPVHVAAMKGNVGVLKELVLEGPSPARVKLERDETVLHLCVKHEQLKSLELLLTMSIGFELVNARDSGGNTILHLAVSGKNFDIVKHIVNYDHHDISLHHKRKKLEVNAMNAEGHTALDIALLEQTGSYKDFLLGAKCKKAKDVVERDWLSKKRDTLMVVASLIATMAFQAAVSPPAGVWQDNSDGHRAGEAVMAYNYPDSYPFFLRANTIAFVSSLSTILLLISDVPFKNRLYMWCLVVIMWLTVTSTAITYVFAIIVVTPKKDRGSLSNTIKVGVIAWCSVMALLLVYHTYKLIKDVWYDYKIKNESNKNITVYGYGDQDRSTGNSAQKPASYNYTVPKLLPSYDNANRQQEIQMVNNDAVQRD